jgi:hypothetical protein
MLNNHKQFLAWRRQVFVRNPHRDLNALYTGLKQRTGVYLIGCAEEIVYIGQSWDLTERPIDSLGRSIVLLEKGGTGNTGAASRSSTGRW